MIVYTVRMEFDDPRVLATWVDWLAREHLDDVCAAGAIDAELLRVDGGHVLEARYRFASREAFARYEQEHAPRLRNEGLARIPPEGGVRFTRSLAEIVRQRG